MRQALTPYKQFEKLTEKKYKILYNTYQHNFEKAREDSKSIAHSNFMNELFNTHKKIQNQLGIQCRFFIDINEELELDKMKTFETEFNQKFKSTKEKNKKSFLDTLSNQFAINKIIEYLRGIENETKPHITHKKLNIIWEGKELEFVQLFYALKEAGYLKNDKNEITTLIKDVAVAFNFNLGVYWQSNLSDNINNRNTDYQPKIFDKLKQGYNDYRERQIDKNKKKKPK